MNNIYTLDFETQAVKSGSDIAPYPVGVSIKLNNDPSHYYAWGHPTNNNCSYQEGMDALTKVYDSGYPIICHNAKFDLRVARDYFNLSIPEPSRIHDTMIMAYLIDAREVSLGLKQLAQKYCGMAPDAQDDLHDWIVANVDKKNPGSNICMAPGDLVGRYAESDTDMTYALFIALSHQVLDQEVIEGKQNITDAYNREMKLLPIIIDLETRGVTISEKVHGIRDKLEGIFKLLELQLSAYGNNTKPGSKAMFQVFRDKGLIDESKIQYTEKGNPRYGKEFITDLIDDEILSGILLKRSRLQKFLTTYLRPFSESSKQYNNKFYPFYNQTRSEDDYGTRTGRLSSNMQQLPKNIITDYKLTKDTVTDDIPPVRSLIVPSSPSKSILKRDFSGQELRVAAHYAEGSVLQAYIDDPYIDIHKFVDDLIYERTGMRLSRTPVKTISFLKLYGGGPATLAKRLDISLDKAMTFFQAYDSALPEFKRLMKDIDKLARSGKKIRTWGGRSYGVEITKDGREMYYKLGNVLIQGSSADMTKEAMIRYYYHPDRKGDLIMTVHDELIVEVEDEFIDSEMSILKWCMDNIKGWDVPLRSDGKVGKSLSDTKDYEEEKYE